jgi:hypothetical protein
METDVSLIILGYSIRYEIFVDCRLLVAIGFTAAFIVMLFPNPISSRVLVRKTLAATLTEAGDVFATEVEAFLAEEAVSRSPTKVDTMEANDSSNDSGLLRDASKNDRMKRMGKRVIVIAVRYIDFIA